MADKPESKPQGVSASAITPQDMPVPTAPVETVAAPVVEKPAAPVEDGNTEKDARGTPFDPARHLHKKHPVSGNWMPKGGRKKKMKAAPSPAISSPATSQDSSGGATSKPAPPPSASFIPAEEKLPVEERSSSAPDARAEVVDHADDAAEVVTRGAQFGAGLVFDDPDAAKVTEGEHRNMTKATAAYIRSKGWQASAGVALALVFIAWMLKIVNKPGPREKVKSWLNKGREPVAAPSPSARENAQEETAQTPPATGSRVVPPLAT